MSAPSPAGPYAIKEKAKLLSIYSMMAIVEGPPQGDRGQMRGIEDTAFIWGGFDFDNIGPVLLEVRPFPNLDRRQPPADGLLGRG